MKYLIGMIFFIIFSVIVLALLSACTPVVEITTEDRITASNGPGLYIEDEC